MYSFSQLKKNLKKDYSGFKKVKLAVLGDSSTQFLVQALRGYAYEYAVDLEIFEADFNQVERQVFDRSSELYDFKPDIVLVFYAAEKLLYRFNKADVATKEHIADEFIGNFANIHQTITSALNSKVIGYNLCEINDTLFGNYANKTQQSFIYQLRKINLELMHMAQQQKDLFICDIAGLQNTMGRSSTFAQNVYINTDSVLSLDFIPVIAKHTLDIVTSLQGRMTKCVILDLDNTLWGGVIGDDGIENIQLGSLGIGKAFTEFQYWLKNLKERGIILAVCSKNDEPVAKTPFESHPDMVLKLDDIAVFVANWENKADNIRYIQSVLNIGFDSMVFIDDNPFERNIVRENIPDITVPELPEDPAEYLSYLYQQNLFETISYSDEDKNRTQQYKVQAQRTAAQQSFTDENAFLESLEMVSEVKQFTKFEVPRVAQLSQRSNQFNLRTVRYTEEDIERMMNDDNYIGVTFTLEDKFGHNGLICVVILEKKNTDVLFIDTWFMSCRVLKRGMEQFVLNTIVQLAKDGGFILIQAEYIPTAKNGMVKDHYKNLGFTSRDDHWYLQVDEFKPGGCFIKAK